MWACAPLKRAAACGGAPPRVPHTVEGPAAPRSARARARWRASGVVLPWSAQPSVSRSTRRAIATTSLGRRFHVSAAAQPARASERLSPAALLPVIPPHLVPALVGGEALEDVLHARPRHVGVAVFDQRDRGEVLHEDLLDFTIGLRAFGLRHPRAALGEELVDLRVAVALHVHERRGADVVAGVDTPDAERRVAVARVVGDVEVEVVLFEDFLE